MQFKREKWELRQMQAMPLRLKIQMTAQRIESWYEYWDSYNIRWEDDGPPGVYLSFSGVNKHHRAPAHSKKPLHCGV